MSLLKTLAKVAVGIAVAKGVGGMMKGGAGGQQTGSGGGLGDLLGKLGGGGAGGQSSGQGGGGLGDLLGKLGGGGQGGQASGGQSGGGLGDLLGQLGGQATRGQQGSGQGGALGDIFGDFIDDGAKQTQNNESFGDMFNDAMAKQDEPEVAPSADQEAVAALMLSAMIQAMKSDKELDPEEEAKLMEHLSDVSDSERQFVNQELQKPIDIQGLVANVPQGLEEQVYLMSVMAIDLDNKQEAQYLHDLATELGIGRQEVDAIHTHLGAPTLYS